jgi:hypothetical protein
MSDDVGTPAAAPHPAVDRSVAVVQRVENGALAAACLAAAIVFFPGLWWMPFALFLVFDLSALGYARSARVGAFWYNLVHNYTAPALLGAAAVVAGAGGADAFAGVAGIASLSWGFHVGADRALGYGLKLPDAFTHTHLGRIGRDRRVS